MAKERKDTPLADTPDSEITPPNLKSALDDINTRIAARQASQNAAQAKLDAAREERSRKRKSVAGGDSGLYGLATFRNSTGRQEKKD